MKNIALLLFGISLTAASAFAEDCTTEEKVFGKSLERVTQEVEDYGFSDARNIRASWLSSRVSPEYPGAVYTVAVIFDATDAQSKSRELLGMVEISQSCEILNAYVSEPKSVQ